MKFFLFTAMLALLTCCTHQKADFSVIIPCPIDITADSLHHFTLRNGMSVGYAEGLKGNAELLAAYILETTGIKLKTVEGVGNINLTLTAQPGENVEGYVLTVSTDGITIEGNSPAGNFYGCQTLRKALPIQTEGTAVDIPVAVIKDEPLFSYRGAHLDCSRHFFPADFVKRYIDILALHNINNFHWHLTDDQGWRVEIKALPELAEKGSVRKQTMIKKEWENFDGKPHTGYYTQEECRDIVAYAAERHINVIPEIDLPGHMVAVLHVYPELGCTGGPYEVCQIWGVMPDVLCAGNPASLELIKTVLSEICDVFPSHYIHIGGDECPRERWAECPKCQAFADKLAKEAKVGKNDKHRLDRLQNYITAEVDKFLQSKGREVIGWDEILEGEVSPTATIMSWRGSDGGIQAARAGHKVIMSPNDYCYIDHYQSPDQEENQDKEPFGICCYLPLEKVYQLKPCPDELTPEEGKFILGPQVNLWTEYVHTTDHAEYMLLPRLAALSESGWTDYKDFDDFERRLSSLVKFYNLYGYKYRPRNEEEQAKMVETIKAGYDWY